MVKACLSAVQQLSVCDVKYSWPQLFCHTVQHGAVSLDSTTILCGVVLYTFCGVVYGCTVLRYVTWYVVVRSCMVLYIMHGVVY